MKQIETKVFTTKDYSLFKRVTGNRAVNSSHVLRIKNSMVDNDLMIPIVVNDKMEVIDGQHRLAARQLAKLPVYYVVVNGLGIEETQRANQNNKNWTTVDFLNHYVELNYHYYKELKSFVKKWEISIGEAMSLLSSQGRDYNIFNSGNFIIDDAEFAVTVAEAIHALKNYYAGYKRRNFILAIKTCMRKKEFDIEEFIKKISYQQTKMVDCTSTVEYLKVIENIYNYMRKTEEKIRLV